MATALTLKDYEQALDQTGSSYADLEAIRAGDCSSSNSELVTSDNDNIALLVEGGAANNLNALESSSYSNDFATASTTSNVSDTENLDTLSEDVTSLKQRRVADFDRSRLEKVSLIGNGTFAKVFLCIYRGADVAQSSSNVRHNVSHNGNEHEPATRYKNAPAVENGEPSLEESRLESGRYLALKVMRIDEMVKLKQVDHVRSEKTILSSVAHPFLVDLFSTWHDSANLFMLFEFIAGGELFTYLRANQRFSVRASAFYAAEITDALAYLHTRGIVYRDLKPENVLIDAEGHTKLIDFGFAKRVADGRTFSLCGTPEYLAPEIIAGRGYSVGVDWWSLGVLVYEMLVGSPPYFDEDPFEIYRRILFGRVEFPSDLDHVSRDLIKKLLVTDRSKRLGCMKQGAQDVIQHRFFRDWLETFTPVREWSDVRARRIDPPLIPALNGAGDVSCFDQYSEDESTEALRTAASERPVDQRYIDMFKDF